MAHYVYKYVVNDEIIYIGKNDTDLHSRIKQHESEPKFKPYLEDCKIYYIELANSIMSDVVESELIRKFKPLLNVAKTSEWSGLPFPSIEWKEYKKTEKKNQEKKKKEKMLSKKERKRLEEKIKYLNKFEADILPIIRESPVEQFIENGELRYGYRLKLETDGEMGGYILRFFSLICCGENFGSYVRSDGDGTIYIIFQKKINMKYWNTYFNLFIWNLQNDRLKAIKKLNSAKYAMNCMRWKNENA